MSRCINDAEGLCELWKTMCSPNHCQFGQHKRQQYSMDCLIVCEDSDLCLHGCQTWLRLISSKFLVTDWLSKDVKCDSVWFYFTVPSATSIPLATSVSPTTGPQSKWIKKWQAASYTFFLVNSYVSVVVVVVVHYFCIDVDVRHGADDIDQ